MNTLEQFSNGLKSCKMPLESVASACRAFLMTGAVDCSAKFQELILKRMKECDNEIDSVVFTETMCSSKTISFDTLFTWICDIVPKQKRMLDSVGILCEIFIKTNGEKGLVDVAKYLLDRIERNVDRLKSVSLLCKVLEAIGKCCCEIKSTETEQVVLTHSKSLLMLLLSEAESKMQLQRVILIDLLPNLFTIREGEDSTLRNRVAKDFVRTVLETLHSKQKKTDYRLRHENLWSLALSCEIVMGVLLVMSTKCSSFDLKSCCSCEELLKIVSIGLLVLPRSLTTKIAPAQEKRAVMLMRLVFETYVSHFIFLRQRVQT